MADMLTSLPSSMSAAGDEEDDDLHPGMLSLFGDPNSSELTPGRFAQHANILQDASDPRREQSNLPFDTIGVTATIQNGPISNFADPGEDDLLSENAGLKTPPYNLDLARVDSAVHGSDRLGFRPGSTTPPTSPFTDNGFANRSDDNGSDGDAEHPRQSPQYRLRGSARGGQHISTTWVDQDESGNYDPSEEHRKTSCKRKRLGDSGAKPSSAEHDANSRAGKRPRTYKSSYTARQNGAQLIFSIGLGNAELREFASRIPDNWPESHNSFTDSSRNERRRNANQESADYIPLTDPLGEEEGGLFGHPVARGCKTCRAVDTRCPLLDDGNFWPCVSCVEDGQECELITPPIRKASCESCKAFKRRCSHRDDATGEQPAKCDHCTSLGIQCIAGPAEGYEYQRKYIGRDYNVDPYIPRRQFVSCSHCRENKSKCSLGKTDDPPCDTCAALDIPCIFEGVRRTRKSKGKSKAETKEAVSSSESDVEEEAPSKLEASKPDSAEAKPAVSLPNSKRGPVRRFGRRRRLWIRTSLCHPVTFNCDTTTNQFSDPFRDCNWCKEASFGIFGHGFGKVLVEEMHQRLAYEEIRGGHEERGAHPSRMCTQCTMARLQIINCPQHDISELTSDIILANNQLIMDDDPSCYLYLCSICPSPPSFRCCSTQEIDASGQELDPQSSEASGCGLLLCVNCREALQQFGGDFQKTLKEMETPAEKYSIGLRADAELLSADGLLVRNVFADMDG
ncbi:hypothetical protein NA57DRAFT_78014 [Rhizodiscina lignyota]|uniref:Zn(2)-C6 fungal-type domain-containing protein n=1 Tax=Rhizodiscina lignyota TaxID=1504668 RepID=A0A9P4IAD5_9PEZI|nr:hypothetical protein NA57DRAFT_78014 [Rhizodiscina lignyota]